MMKKRSTNWSMSVAIFASPLLRGGWKMCMSCKQMSSNLSETPYVQLESIIYQENHGKSMNIITFQQENHGQEHVKQFDELNMSNNFYLIVAWGQLKMFSVGRSSAFHCARQRLLKKSGFLSCEEP